MQVAVESRAQEWGHGTRVRDFWVVTKWEWTREHGIHGQCQNYRILSIKLKMAFKNHLCNPIFKDGLWKTVLNDFDLISKMPLVFSYSIFKDGFISNCHHPRWFFKTVFVSKSGIYENVTALYIKTVFWWLASKVCHKKCFI